MTATVTVLALIAALAYVGACFLTPFTDCRHCKGEGKRSRLLSRSVRACTYCAGTGKRKRLGRRWWTAVRR